MITRTARSLFRLNNSMVAYSFCFGKAHLNPYKHNTMSHSPHNIFVELYDFGEYPEIIAPASIAARTYEPLVISTAVQVLNSKYGTKLTAEDFNSRLQKPWARFILKDLKTQDSIFEVLTPVLNRLAGTIFVRESRWTWIKEQRERSVAGSIYFKRREPQTLGEFLEGYNALIQQLVLASSFGLSPHIPQASSALEKHYVQEMADSEHQGVSELNNLQGEQNNFINRALSFIHRI